MCTNLYTIPDSLNRIEDEAVTEGCTNHFKYQGGEASRAAHEARRPQLTILFGSRVRGDYAEGRSDIDILVIEGHPPREEAAGNAKMAFRKAKAEL